MSTTIVLNSNNSINTTTGYGWIQNRSTGNNDYLFVKSFDGPNKLAVGQRLTIGGISTTITGVLNIGRQQIYNGYCTRSGVNFNLWDNPTTPWSGASNPLNIGMVVNVDGLEQCIWFINSVVTASSTDTTQIFSSPAHPFSCTYSLYCYSVSIDTATANVGTFTAPLQFIGGISYSNSTLQYYFDWERALTRGKKYYVDFSFISAGNNVYVAGAPRAALCGEIELDLPIMNNYYNKQARDIATNTNVIGSIMPVVYSLASTIGCYQSLPNMNTPSILYDVPRNNLFNVRIINSKTQRLFTDSTTFTGNASQSGTTLTIETITSGGNHITLDTRLNVGGVNVTILGFISGNGGTGTYLVDYSQSVASSAYTGQGGDLGDYILTLQFTPVLDDIEI